MPRNVLYCKLSNVCLTNLESPQTTYTVMIVIMQGSKLMFGAETQLGGGIVSTLSSSRLPLLDRSLQLYCQYSSYEGPHKAMVDVIHWCLLVKTHCAGKLVSAVIICRIPFGSHCQLN